MIAERLKHDEPVRIDTDRVARLYIDLGTDSAEAVLCKYMEDLAIGLARIERHRAAGRNAEMVDEADKLTIVAERVGLSAVARVAQSVGDCARQGDPVALTATLARLSRLGDRSLSAIWDPEEVLG